MAQAFTFRAFGAGNKVFDSDSFSAVRQTELHPLTPVVLTVLEQRIDEGRNGRTLGEQEQSTNRHQGYDNRSEPILLIVPHKLPQLGNNLYF